VIRQTTAAIAVPKAVVKAARPAASSRSKPSERGHEQEREEDLHPRQHDAQLLEQAVVAPAQLLAVGAVVEPVVVGVARLGVHPSVVPIDAAFGYPRDMDASSTRQQHSHLHRWGAAYLLAVLFLASWAGQFVMTLVEVGNEARQHGGSFHLDEFWPTFLSATFENWQSEWLQLLVQAVVLLGMKHVLFKADAEDMEAVQRDLAQIKAHLGITDDPG